MHIEIIASLFLMEELDDEMNKKNSQQQMTSQIVLLERLESI